MPSPPVNVKTADRRSLHFDTLEEVLSDAETITDGGHTDPPTTGNWNAAQIIYHIAQTIHMANHGGSFTVPFPVKLMGRTLKLFGVHRKPIKPGINPPGKVAAAFAAPDGVTLDQAMDKLRTEVATANQHEMSHPSPLFGKLSHNDWVHANCRHAELHFGFIKPTPPDSAG